MLVPTAVAALGLGGVSLGEIATNGAAAQRTNTLTRIAIDEPPVDCGNDFIIVFGNSTDYAAGTTPDSIELAWPNVLARKLEALGSLGVVNIDNESKPGSTMAAPNPWGTDTRWRWVTDIPVVLDRYPGVPRRHIVMLLAPSIIDLTVTTGNVMATVGALDQVLRVIAMAGIGDVIVLPMNPVADLSLANVYLPGINRLVAQFNAALAARGLLNAYPTSPLIGTAPAGDPVHYDDYLLPSPGGGPARPDYLHIDAGGHAHIAGRLVRELPRLLSTMCAN